MFNASSRQGGGLSTCLPSPHSTPSRRGKCKMKLLNGCPSHSWLYSGILAGTECAPGLCHILRPSKGSMGEQRVLPQPGNSKCICTSSHKPTTTKIKSFCLFVVLFSRSSVFKHQTCLVPQLLPCWASDAYWLYPRPPSIP